MTWVKEVKIGINSNLSLSPSLLYTVPFIYIGSKVLFKSPPPTIWLYDIRTPPTQFPLFYACQFFLSVYPILLGLFYVSSVYVYLSYFFPSSFVRWMCVPKLRKKERESALHVHSTTRSRSITNEIKISSHLKKIKETANKF